MQTGSKVLKSIKRNPIINVAVLAIVCQAVVEAIDDGNFDLRTVATYVLQLSLAYVAREFTVPAKEHAKEVEDAYMRGLVIPHATPGIDFPEEK